MKSLKGRPADAMAEAMIRRHKKATRKKGCSWRAVVRDTQRELVDIMQAPDRAGDSSLMQSTALLNALPMIKGAVPRDVYDVAVRAAARLSYVGMNEVRPRPAVVVAPPSVTVH